MFEKHYFIARACSESSQAGKIQAHGLIPNEIRFTAPEEFGGEPSAWTPEHFLLSAISSCFIATFQAISKASNFQFAGLEVVSEGVVEKVDNRLRFASVTVNPLVMVDSEEDRERAQKLLTKTERSCIVANSLSTAVAFAPQIVIEQHALAVASVD